MPVGSLFFWQTKVFTPFYDSNRLFGNDIYK